MSVLDAIHATTSLQNEFNDIKNSGDLTQQGKEKEYERIISTIDSNLSKWKSEVDSASTKINKEIESSRPSEESIDSIEVTLRSYNSQQFKSRLAGEVFDRASFMKLSNEMANHHNKNHVQAFVDNFHEVVNRANQIFDDKQDREMILVALRQQYREAKERIKPNYIKNYEAKVSEAENKLNRYNSSYATSKQLLNNLKGQIKSEVQAKQIGW